MEAYHKGQMMEEKNSKKITDHRFFMLAFTGLFFFAMHLTFAAFTNDDSFFKIISEGEPLSELLLERYRTDSSRVLSEAFLFTFVQKPFIVWQICDTLICMLLAYSAASVFGIDRHDKKNWLIFLLFACYPYMHMGSAGWICTSLNYIWPLAAFLYTLSVALRRYRGEKVSDLTVRLSLITAVFAANCEQSAAVTFLSFGLILYFIITGNRKGEKSGTHKKKSFWLELTVFCIGIFGIIFALTAPGNGARTEMEAANWMPEFFDLTILDKLRLCSVFVFEHFVMIPDVIFFMFSLLLFPLGRERIKKGVKAKGLKCAVVLPLCIDVIFTAVYFVKDFIIGHKTNYDFTTPSIFIKDAGTAFVQISELAGLVIYIAAAVYTLWHIFPETEKRLVSVYSLGTGFAVRMALMLSPTMFASWHRVLIFMYFAFLGDSYMMINELLPLKKKWQRNLIVAVIICGIVVNLILTVGLQLRKRGLFS